MLRIPSWIKAVPRTVAGAVKRDPTLVLVAVGLVVLLAMMLLRQRRRRRREGLKDEDMDWAKEFARRNCRAGYTMQQVVYGYGLNNKDWSDDDKEEMKMSLKAGCAIGQAQWKGDKGSTHDRNQCPTKKLCPNRTLRRSYPCLSSSNTECCMMDGSDCISKDAGKQSQAIAKAKAKGCPRNQKINNCYQFYQLKCERGGKGSPYAWRCCDHKGKCPDNANENRADHVTVYQKAYQKGETLNLTVGEYANLPGWGGYNWGQTISSMVVPQGLNIIMYKGANFTGDPITFGPGTRSLGYPWNNYGDSLKVVRVAS